MKRFVVVMTVWAMGLAGVLAGVVFPSSASAAAPTGQGAYGSLAPSRLLDTRIGVGAAKAAVAPNGTVSLLVAGRGGVPTTGVSAVVLNVTVTAPFRAGFITVFGSGKARPGVSNVNFLPGQVVSNLVIAPVGVDGRVNLFNGSAGGTNLVADVTGYYLSGAPTNAGAFGSVAPVRMLDTRIGQGAAKGQVPSNGTVDLQITGRGGVPAGVSAVVLNVTATGSTQNGVITVFGTGTTPRPVVSNLNFAAGQTVPNLVIAPVSADGKVTLVNDSLGSTSVIADAFGYFKGGAPVTTGAYGSVVPERLLDTRDGAAVAANGSLNLKVTGSVPAGASAVVLNVTATQPAEKGFITVFGAGTTPRPVVSNLNFLANQSVPSLVIAPVGANGEVTLFNGSTGATHLLADVSGYFLDDNVDVVPPGAITGLTAGTVTPTSIALSWTNPTADFDKVMIRRAEGATPPATTADGTEVLADTATSTIDDGLTAGTEYSYAVFALDAAGNPSVVAELTKTTNPDIIAPEPVTGLTATTTDSSITLSWTNPAADFTGVTIRRAEGDTAPATIAEGTDVPTDTATTAIDTGLTRTNPGTQYSYAVFAHDGADPANYAAGIPVTATTVDADLTAPGPLTGLFVRAESSTATSVALHWINPTDADFTGVMIRRAIGTTPPATVNDGVLVRDLIDDVPYVVDITGVTSNTQYSYSLFAHDGANNYAAAANVTYTTTTTAPIAVLSFVADAEWFDFDASASTADTGIAVATGTLDYGDGTPVEPLSDEFGWFASHSYAAAGDYQVTLTVVDSAGVSATTVKTVTVTPGAPGGPTATITGPTAPVSVGVPVEFTLTTTGPPVSNWTLSDENGFWGFDFGAPPGTMMHTFTDPGTYTVVFTFNDNAGGSAETSMVVTVVP